MLLKTLFSKCHIVTNAVRWDGPIATGPVIAHLTVLFVPTHVEICEKYVNIWYHSKEEDLFKLNTLFLL